ncbi:dienelactone hydrolase family protein [Crocosphaera sp. UHCC 0190]|uniref:dienelactone hydrolase family protein n=1 Tax=Crocosphaera sp. UHCC 0190 TaxID=3110246 RepID=UPI002B21E901|nr:dienelactone hydrolase family protein [Crocosphaera sp. UHCC 0190]MEA5511082.1 dienelactone hydrolase family protein [Crocosphaera sp. UHCC 0190]
MTELEIKTQQVSIQNGHLEIDSYLAIPEAEGLFPGVIVIQEIFGVNEHIRDITRRLAKQGYVAITPAIYQRQAPGFETGYTPESIEIGRVYKNQTKASELLSDIQATIDYLYTLPQVKKTGLGTIGFCFGGHVVYLVSTLKEIKATASFYGAGIANWMPGEEGKATVDCTPDIKGTLYGFFGMEDRSIPVEQVNMIESALKQNNIPHRIFKYPGAGHGFFCDKRASYHGEAAKDAWQKVLELLRNEL